MMANVTIIDDDHCVFTQDDGVLVLSLHCDRLSGRWHAPFVVMNGEEKRTPDCFELNDDVRNAIEDAYAERAIVGEGGTE
jgi:hypothetical protein